MHSIQPTFGQESDQDEDVTAAVCDSLSRYSDVYSLSKESWQP